MANFRQFKEYLDTKGKTQTKPKVDPAGDTAPLPPKAPLPAAKKGKNWENKAATSDKPAPYTPATSPAKPQKPEPGLANKGDKKLVYDPETPEEFNKEGGKKLTTFPKTTATTKEFLEKTRKMSLSEFTTLISNENQANSKVNPLQYIKYVAQLTAKNPKLMESLVREIKRNNGIESLTCETMKLPEVVNEVAIMLQDEKFCQKINKAIRYETVDAPASETEFDDVVKKKSAHKRRTKSIGGEKLDMGNSDVVTTKTTVA
jgi:hypothetical protein